jgi:RNA polymerase sigma-70 factor (ECF subfamily)
MPAADEQQLIREAQDGNRSAFRILVERHVKQAYNVAYGFVQDHDSAHDVMQDALVRAYQALPGFRGDAEFGTWLHRIVTNVALNHLRSCNARARRELRIDEVAEPGVSHDGDMHARQVREHLELALRGLPALQRSVVTLRHIEGLSTREVGTLLGCSEGTVKTHLFRGLKKLRQKLQYLQEDIP